jgi:NAD(P)-dependent dehydrogenase (short-subunit alcohol dehydrogenase family)
MDRVVIVTGAGGGLGRALARGLAGQGDRVVAIGRDAAALAETGAGLAAASFQPCVADVGDHDGLIAAIRGMIARHGRVDGLFANAATYPRGLVSEQPLATFMTAMAVNVGGVAASIQAVLPAMMDRARGRIVTVGSFADRGPLPDSAAYSASKGALHALTKAAAAEVGADYPDLLVNEWVPGSLATRMGVADGHPPERAAAWGLALLDLPAGGPTGQIFVEDRMEEPPLGLKQRLRRKLRLA